MDILLLLIPVALFLGGLGLVGFLWALRSGQFDDPQGAAERILYDEDDTPPQRKTPPLAD
ncbi:MAG: cbb3-type cytochrome oxidase assembly protein CcoS [Pseudomonadota bacterium]